MKGIHIFVFFSTTGLGLALIVPGVVQRGVSGHAHLQLPGNSGDPPHLPVA